ncbi:putative gustatory receptor 98b [Drosophila innubila]|uniref:putative gustatory receptor 98b n=1 Tax=Drosophila innubila TaxID=198719 RepID=UPI00148E3FEC|nr:putative gustatory receptor 98b [Drosophila innubila]
MKGQLLATARPYLQLFSLLSLTPPPSSYERSHHSWQWKLLMLIFTCYTCCTCLLGAYISYVNIMILEVEIKDLMVEDFTYALGLAQKIIFLFALGTSSAHMLIYYHKLGRIYCEISTIELDIVAAFQSIGSQRKHYNFRVYLFKRIGLWTIFLFVAIPRLTFPLLTDFITYQEKILTEFILLVLQFKSLQYTLLVILIQELLLRLRHKLIQIQQELTVCEQHVLLQALVQAMRKNKHLLACIWKLVSELEEYFMLPMLLFFLYNGVCMLHIVNWAFIQAVNPNDCCRYLRFGRFLILLFNLLIPCWISHNCIRTYNSFSRILHSIRCGSSLVTPQLLKMILMEYALQMEHLKLRFTCGGFFDINLKYFAGIVVTIVSYTIILIQFKMQAMVEAKQAAKQLLNLRLTNKGNNLIKV